MRFVKNMEHCILLLTLASVLAPLSPFSAEANPPKGDGLNSLLAELNTHQAPSEKEAFLKRIIKDDPADESAYLLLGDLYFNSDKMEEAENVFKAGLSTHPDAHGMRNYLVSVYIDLKQYKKAEEQSEKIIRAAPNFGPAYINYGIMEQERGNYHKGIEYLNKGFSLAQEFNQPLSADQLVLAHIRLGHCYGEVGRYDDAILEYESACQLKPSSPLIQTHDWLGTLYLSKALKTKDPSFVAKAVVHYNQLSALSPSLAAKGFERVKTTERKLGIKSSVVVKRSGDVLLVFPKKYEEEAENLKAALDKK